MFGPARSSRMFPSSFKQESPYFLPLEPGGLSLPSCLTNHGSGDILWFLMLGYKARRGPALVSQLGLCGSGALCTTRERLPAPTTQRERETETERAGSPNESSPQMAEPSELTAIPVPVRLQLSRYEQEPPSWAQNDPVIIVYATKFWGGLLRNSR